MSTHAMLVSLLATAAAGAQPDALKDVVQPDWSLVQGDDAARFSYEDLEYSSDDWYGSTFWTGPDWTRVGRDWQHSGNLVNSVRVFNAPKPGKAQVTGRCYKADVKCGDGVALAIRHNAKTVWSAQIDFADTTGVEFDLEVDLAPGDRLRFALANGGEISCDTTYWDPAITYADGEVHRASEGFGEETGVWSYEMETDEGQTSALAPGWEVRQWISPDASRGALSISRGDSETPEQTVPLAALDASSKYRVTEAPAGQATLRTGDDLMRTGLSIVLPPGNALAIEYALGRGAVSTAIPAAAADLSVSRDGRLTWSSGPDLTHVVWRDGDVITRTRGATYHDATLLPGHVARYAVQTERGFLRSRPTEVAMVSDDRPELDLWRLVEADWARTDPIPTPAAYAEIALDQLDRAEKLGADLDPVSALREVVSTPDVPRGTLRQAYLEARWIKRNAALGNPLLDFGELLFAKRVPTEYSHLVMQYFGWRARPGGGIHVLGEPGRSLRTRNILAGQLEGGSVLAPRLSYDAKRVVFSYSSCSEDDPYFHIYEVGVDGSGLRQLTSGEYEDLMPAYLPDGGVIFSSTRRRGYSRCFGGQFGDKWHVYTLHRMDGDGGNLRTLSFHETNEWFPSVLNDGSVAYARWDYVDRHAVLHQNLWRTSPDGTGASVLWGNHTQVPHCSFEAQAIPGSSKIICTGSAHHSVTGGSIFIIDPNIDYDGHEAIERITPDVPFPEAESWPSSYYATPWPLSEDVYLVSFSHDRLIPEPDPNDPAALGLYYLDRWGNRELLYRDPQIGSTTPIPVAARPMPPVLPSALPRSGPDEGEIVLLDVHRGLPEEYAGQVKALRVIQLLPKSTPIGDVPPVGLAGQENTRLVLGTVPVADDGSAHFKAPARKALLFQALDAQGMAIHTMRSTAYLQPGEKTSCIGCHESRTEAPESRIIAAGNGEAVAITPGPEGSNPFSFARLVQPVLDRHCVSCHGDDEPAKGLSLTGTPEAPWTKSYLSLTGGKTFYQAGTNAENAAKSLVPRFGGWNSVHVIDPGGMYGSRGSRLMGMLLDGHEDVQLDAESIERLATWIDCNAVFYGTYDPAEQAKQLRGEIIDVPPLQ